jgi:hypothetical protein
MATFAFSGRTRAGQTINGERAADSMDAAVALLRREQILVTQIAPAREKASAKAKGPKDKAVAAKNLAIFTRQFSVMIDAGLPLVQVPRDSRQPGGRQEFFGRHPRDSRRRRERCDARRRDAQAPEDI